MTSVNKIVTYVHTKINKRVTVESCRSHSKNSGLLQICVVRISVSTPDSLQAEIDTQIGKNIS
jgi:hypothetical protein